MTEFVFTLFSLWYFESRACTLHIICTSSHSPEHITKYEILHWQQIYNENRNKPDYILGTLF